MNMYILGGYQKTGTEWLKFILVNLFRGRQLTWGAYDTMLPNFSACGISPTDWYKTHAYANHNSDGLCQVRHPFDVCMSAYRYVKEVDQLEVPDICTFIDLFILNRGEITFNQMNGCDYVEHVEHWWTAHNTTIIKHEDLRGAYGATHLHKALSRMGFDVSFEQVWRAMDLATVDRMRELDDRNFLGTTRSTWREAWSDEQVVAGLAAFDYIFGVFGYSV